MEITKLIIKYDGFININGLLEFIMRWFIDRKWKLDKESVKHKTGELEYEFIFSIRETDYVESKIKVWFIIKDIKELADGSQSGRMRMEIYASLNEDWQKAFSGSRFWARFKNFYETFIFGRELYGYWADKLYYVAHKLQGDIKEYLNMTAKANAYRDMYKIA